MSMQWESKFGPASILAVAQLLAIIIGFVYAYAKLENTSTNTQIAADALTVVVNRQRERTDALNERMIAVEIGLKNVADSLNRVATKLDRGAAQP